MSKFDDIHVAINDKVNTSPSPSVDADALQALVAEFGGLAGWKCKKDNGEWSRDGWDQLMLRLYRNRRDLDGIVDEAQRGKTALDAMSDSESSDLKRLMRQLDSA